MKKNILSFRTKAEVILLVGLLICMSVVSVMSVTRTITDSSDNIETFIKNSNGNYWSATGANIQLAIDDLTTGGTVWLPGSTDFLITVQLDITANGISLIGQGESTLIKMTSAVVNDDVININGADNVLIQGINIHGDHLNNVGINGYGIMIINSQNIDIKNCIIQNTTSHGILVYKNSQNVTVDGCHIYDINKSAFPGGIVTMNDTCIFKNNRINDTYSCGIIIEGYAGSIASYNIIENNIFYGEMHTAIWMESALSDNATINGNIIQHSGSTAYGAIDSTGIYLEEYSIASNNIIEGMLGKGISGTGDSITVSSNQITNTGGYAIELITGINQVCSNNIVVNCDNDTCALRMHGTGISITGNMIDDTEGSGIEGYWSIKNSVALGNTLENIKGTYGIWCIDIVSDNYIQGDGTTVGIMTCNLVANNHIENCNYGIKTGSRCHIVDNLIKSSVNSGINAEYYHNTSIMNNYIDGGANGIKLSSIRNCTVSGNFIRDCTDGIHEYASADYNVFMNNDLRFNTNEINGGSSNTIISSNIGYNYDSLQDDYIWNSNGKYWTATETNLQSAITDLTSGGTVTIPSGTIEISSAITLGNDIHLTGMGVATILELADGADCEVIENSDQTNGNNNITISNLKIDGNRDGQTGNRHHQGIVLLRCEYCTIKDVFVTNASEGGMVLADGFFNVVDSCRITKCGWLTGSADSREYGISFEGENQSSIVNCHADSVNSVAFNIATGRGDNPTTKGIASYNCSMIGNIAYNCSAGLWTERLYYGTISNNIVANCSDKGAGIDPKGISCFGGSHLTIDGNVFRDADSSLEGLRLQSCYSSVVSNNVIVNILGGYGIKSQGAAGTCGYNIITGNYIENVDNDGIYVITGENVTISGNTIKDAGEWGIKVHDNNCTVTNNLISGTVLYDGIKFESLNGGIISNNVLSNIKADGIDIKNSRDIIVTGNLVNGDGAGAGDSGVQVDGSSNCIASLNILNNFATGIDEANTCDWNIYVGNMATGCTNGFDFNGANNNVTANMGTHI